MTIKVHGHVFSTSTTRVLACLNEKGLPFELVSVNMQAGDHKKEPFLSFNPFGQAPAFEDGDLKMFESRAITQYIAHTYAHKGSKLIAKDHKKMAIISVWTEVEAHQFNPAASTLNAELVIKPMRGLAADEVVVAEYETKLGSVLDVYEARLAQTKYLAGDSFTLADLHHIPLLGNLMRSKAKKLFDARPHVSAWSADILARPAWLKVLALLKHN